jgi:hypothetical protein
MILLFVAGGVLGAAGLLALGFGIPIKDTTFGNAMLLSGMVLLCTSLILVGLGLVVRELKAVGRALVQGGVRAAPRGLPARPGAPRPASLPHPGLAPPIDSGAPPLVDEPPPIEAQPAAPGAPPPWAGEAAARDRARNVSAASRQAASPPVENPAPPPPAARERPPRRNLLFATRKRDRAEAAGGSCDDQPASPELPKMAPPVLPPMTALEAEPKASFDSAWPTPSRGTDPFARRSRSAEAPPGAATEPSAGESGEPTPPPLPPATEAVPAVTVIKSGVVDGMAYSLYSDGSIEAQMPEGMLRFASLDELRKHLEQRP